MSDAVEPVVSAESTTQTADPAKFPDTTATSSGGSTDSMTTVSSLADLKTKAPEVYQKMLEGIASNIITEMKRRQEHIKEIMREGRRNAGQG